MSPDPPPATARNAMRAIASPYPGVLEARLASSIAAIKKDDPLSAVLIVAPSILLLDRLKRALSVRLGAVLNIEFLYHRRVAEEALLHAGPPNGPPPAVADPQLLAQLLAGIIRGGEGPLHEYARAWPGAVRALLATFRDLRDAGVQAADLAQAAGSLAEDDGLPDLLALYGSYVAALATLGARGLTDGAGLVEAALPAVPAWSGRFSHVFHYGAYDLIGVHARLMGAVSEGAPLTWLVPADPEAPAFAPGRRLLEGIGGDNAIEWAGELPPEGGPAVRAVQMFSESAFFDAPLPEGTIELFHAQGARAEAVHAARLAMQAVVDEGVAPEQVAVVARDMDSYAPLILPELASCGLAARAQATRPLSSDPGAQGFLFLLRALLGDFERQAVVDLLRSSAFAGDALAGITGRPFAPDLWDRWSRRAGVIRGREMWVEGIGAWLETRSLARTRDEGAPGADPDRLLREGLICVLDALAAAREAWFAAPSRWGDHARAIRDIAKRFLRPFQEGDDPAARQILAFLDDLEALDQLDGLAPVAPASAEGAFRYLQEAIGSGRLRSADLHPGGVRVIDLMQARCVPFTRTILLGFNQGVFPRKQLEDPFLPDEGRRTLGALLEKPVPLKLEGESEERILLGLLVAGTGGRLSIGWQRADSDGRARAPSLALREIVRIREGKPIIDRVLDDDSLCLRLKSHPLEALQQTIDAHGRLRFSEALTAAGLGLAGDAEEPGRALCALRESLGRENPGVAHGLALIARTEAWSGRDLSFDGIVGTGAASLLPARLSVSAFQRLGRCPLAFFMQDVLRVLAMDTVGEEGESDPWETGELVHILLARVYEQLSAERLFGASPEALVERGLALIGQHWREVFNGPANRMGRFLPLLWEIESGRWRAEVEAFLRADLERLAAAGSVPIAVEQTLEETLVVSGAGSPDRIPVAARLDRIVRDRDGNLRVGDYKTSGNPAYRIDLKLMLRGEELQVPLYVLATEQWLGAKGEPAREVGGEILALGPGIDPGKRSSAAGPHAPDTEKFRKVRAGIEETLGILLAQARAGNFTMIPSRRCDHCSYLRGCRRNHPPSLTRMGAAEILEPLRRVRGKTQRNPLLEGPAPGASGRRRR